MKVLSALKTFLFYFLHPFKSNQLLNDSMYFKPLLKGYNPIEEKISLYESLGFAWAFVVARAIIRMFFIIIIIFLFLEAFLPKDSPILQFYSGDSFIGFYFIVLTTILDVVFFPLVSLFAIQFWTMIFKAYAYLAGNLENIDQKSEHILSVSLSSYIISVFPIFGPSLQRIYHFIQLYAGIRVQFKYSAILTLCVLFTPYLLILGFISLITFVILLKTSV